MDRTPARARFWTATIWILALPWALEAASWPLATHRAPKTHVVEVRGFVYSPSSLNVAVGDTVVWINRDPVPHTATAEHGAWDSGTMQPGESWRHVFTGKGQVGYLCALHPSMKATLTIQ